MNNLWTDDVNVWTNKCNQICRLPPRERRERERKEGERERERESERERELFHFLLHLETLLTCDTLCCGPVTDTGQFCP